MFHAVSHGLTRHAELLFIKFSHYGTASKFRGSTNQEQTITKGVSSCLDKSTAPRLGREIKFEVVWKMLKKCSKHTENQNVPGQYASTSTQLNLLG